MFELCVETCQGSRNQAKRCDPAPERSIEPEQAGHEDHATAKAGSPGSSPEHARQARCEHIGQETVRSVLSSPSPISHGDVSLSRRDLL
jgi:hypothetical protein